MNTKSILPPPKEKKIKHKRTYMDLFLGYVKQINYNNIKWSTNDINDSNNSSFKRDVI